eukprot:83939-Hanusia_phi.AAC.16
MSATRIVLHPPGPERWPAPSRPLAHLMSSRSRGVIRNFSYPVIKFYSRVPPLLSGSKKVSFW